MTAITHQLIAIAAALLALLYYPTTATLALGILCLIAVMIGALTPDLDQPAANLWQRMLGARAFGNVFQAFSGGHRHFTHSLLGIFAIKAGAVWFITHIIHPHYLNEARLVVIAFMIGYVSHSVADTVTDNGVPWLWPLRWHLRLPPGPRAVRITTGSFVELLLVRCGVVIAIALLLQRNWPVVTSFFQH